MAGKGKVLVGIRHDSPARVTKKGKKVNVEDIPSNISYLKDYLKNLKGKKILTLEESTSSQWLYSELKPCVNKLLVCDPYRNHLLSEGAKNDKIDATKLVYLNKAGLLKEVYHSGEDFIYLRKLVSGGRSYGRKSPRYYRLLKQVFKVAAQSVTRKGCNNPLKVLYEYYMEENNKSSQMAKHNVSRRLAVLVYGVLKSGKRYDPNRREKELRKENRSGFVYLFNYFSVLKRLPRSCRSHILCNISKT